jgi:transposase-like protein
MTSSLDIQSTDDIKNLLKDHLEISSEENSSHIAHLKEALSLAEKKTSILSESQKGSAILALLGEEDSRFLIHLIRWKNGVTCPFCGSAEVKKLMGRGTHQYRCMNCEGGEYNGEFDELTGYFPKGDGHSARIWVLINYLKIFMPLSKISKLLGITLEQAMMIMSMVQPADLADKKMKHNSPLSSKKDFL